MAILPIGWAYYCEIDKVPIHNDMLLTAKDKGQLVHIFPCATAFLLSINEDRTRFVTASHAFPDLQQDKADIGIMVPDFFKCPYIVSMDDIKLYIGSVDFIRLEKQDVCIFEVDTPESLYIQHPLPLSLGVDFQVGDEVCTIGYPFIGFEEGVSEGRRNMRFVERLTYAHLSAIWPNRDVFTLEFDNYIGPGNSGGPLINVRTGAVIGVVTWSRVEEEHHSITTFSHATCITELTRALEKYPDLRDMGLIQSP